MGSRSRRSGKQNTSTETATSNPMFGADGSLDVFGDLPKTTQSSQTPTLDAAGTSGDDKTSSPRPWSSPVSFHDFVLGTEVGHGMHLGAEALLHGGTDASHMHGPASGSMMSHAGKALGPATTAVGAYHLGKGLKNGDAVQTLQGGAEMTAGVSTTMLSFGVGGSKLALLAPLAAAGAFGLAYGSRIDKKSKDRCWLQNDGGRCESISDHAARKGKEARHNAGGGVKGALAGLGVTGYHAIGGGLAGTGMGLVDDFHGLTGNLDDFELDHNALGYDDSLLARMSDEDRRLAIEHQVFASDYRALIKRAEEDAKGNAEDRKWGMSDGQDVPGSAEDWGFTSAP